MIYRLIAGVDRGEQGQSFFTESWICMNISNNRNDNGGMRFYSSYHIKWRKLTKRVVSSFSFTYLRTGSVCVSLIRMWYKFKFIFYFESYVHFNTVYRLMWWTTFSLCKHWKIINSCEYIHYGFKFVCIRTRRMIKIEYMGILCTTSIELYKIVVARIK